MDRYRQHIDLWAERRDLRRHSVAVEQFRNTIEREEAELQTTHIDDGWIVAVSPLETTLLEMRNRLLDRLCAVVAYVWLFSSVTTSTPAAWSAATNPGRPQNVKPLSW